jgi:hypothetical protein
MDKKIMSTVIPQTMRRYKAGHSFRSFILASILWDSPARFLLSL